MTAADARPALADLPDLHIVTDQVERIVVRLRDAGAELRSYTHEGGRMTEADLQIAAPDAVVQRAPLAFRLTLAEEHGLGRRVLVDATDVVFAAVQAQHPIRGLGVVAMADDREVERLQRFIKATELGREIRRVAGQALAAPPADFDPEAEAFPEALRALLRQVLEVGADETIHEAAARVVLELAEAQRQAEDHAATIGDLQALARTWCETPPDSADSFARGAGGPAAGERVLQVIAGRPGVTRALADLTVEELDRRASDLEERTRAVHLELQRRDRATEADRRRRGVAWCEDGQHEVPITEINRGIGDFVDTCNTCADENRRRHDAATFAHTTDCPGGKGAGGGVCDWTGTGAEAGYVDEDGTHCPRCDEVVAEVLAGEIVEQGRTIKPRELAPGELLAEGDAASFRGFSDTVDELRPYVGGPAGARHARQLARVVSLDPGSEARLSARRREHERAVLGAREGETLAAAAARVMAATAAPGSALAETVDVTARVAAELLGDEQADVGLLLGVSLAADPLIAVVEARVMEANGWRYLDVDCARTVGATDEIIRAGVRAFVVLDAAAWWQDGTHSRGTISVSRDGYARLRAHCEAAGVSMSAWTERQIATLPTAAEPAAAPISPASGEG